MIAQSLKCFSLQSWEERYSSHPTQPPPKKEKNHLEKKTEYLILPKKETESQKD